MVHTSVHFIFTHPSLLLMHVTRRCGGVAGGAHLFEEEGNNEIVI